jgi:hypothetical protein
MLVSNLGIFIPNPLSLALTLSMAIFYILTLSIKVFTVCVLGILSIKVHDSQLLHHQRNGHVAGFSSLHYGHELCLSFQLFKHSLHTIALQHHLLNNFNYNI